MSIVIGSLMLGQWADIKFCVDWVKGTFSNVVYEINELVLSCDNLKG